MLPSIPQTVLAHRPFAWQRGRTQEWTAGKLQGLTRWQWLREGLQHSLRKCCDSDTELKVVARDERFTGLSEQALPI